MVFEWGEVKIFPFFTILLITLYSIELITLQNNAKSTFFSPLYYINILAQ